MAENVTILGVRIKDRVKEAGEVQKILTKYGCSIKTRLGLHEATDDHCSPSGLIILELSGSQKEQVALYETLQKVQGVLTQKMEL